MIRRFSLYGLLKNQRYFEAFVVLAFVERGLSFAQIGVLVALRELVAMGLEVPSGVLADGLGRRRCMVAAFAAYVVAYLVLGGASRFGLVAVGMALVGVGDAFRSGTHKAMIFDWLARSGRTDERVRVYGRTRSWSKVGSALAVPLAAAVVVGAGGYDEVFWLSAIPAALNLVNLATYPADLEGPRRASASLRETARALRVAAGVAWRRPALRRLSLEAAIVGGAHRASKDYLQPLLGALAAGTSLGWAGDAVARSALLIGAAYLALFGLGAVASRHAHRVVDRAGGLEPGARLIRAGITGLYGLMLVGTGLAWPALSIATFVLLAVAQDLFRPVLVARVDEQAPAELAATVLSVESQATSLGAAGIALLVGVAVDAASSAGAVQLWPVAAVGSALCLGLSLVVARPEDAEDPTPPPAAPR